jgi:hypothetical protein
MTTIHHSFPRSLTQSGRFYLTTATQNLHSLYPAFQSHYLSTSPEAPEPPSGLQSGGRNSDANDIGIPELACSIVDYLTGASRGRGVREVFVSDPAAASSASAKGKSKAKGKGREDKEAPSAELLALVDALLNYTQMTRDDVRWVLAAFRANRLTTSGL